MAQAKQRTSAWATWLGLLIAAILGVQLLLMHKQTALHVPDLHPLQTQQKTEATKLLQSLEDARQRLEQLQHDVRRDRAALERERAALRNATAARPAAPAAPTLIQGILMHVDRPENYLRRALASLLTECRETALLRVLVVDATPGARGAPTMRASLSRSKEAPN